MLRRTFRLIPGIGTRREQGLWDAGVDDWSKLSSQHLSPVLWHRGQESLAAAEQALARGDAGFFCGLLPSDQHWRLIPAFKDRALYLDIETTGLDPWRSTITTIGVFDGRSYRVFVQGRDLDRFPDFVREHTVLVTFNGKQFDVPFIEQSLGIRMPTAHLDLRFLLAACGFRGGLKLIQARLGHVRPGGLDEVDGRMAVWLWRMYRRTGDSRYLDTLITYNLQDVAVLPALLAHAYNQHSRQTPFRDAVPMGTVPVPPRLVSDEYCRAVVRAYRGESGRWTAGQPQEFAGDL